MLTHTSGVIISQYKTRRTETQLGTINHCTQVSAACSTTTLRGGWNVCARLCVCVCDTNIYEMKLFKSRIGGKINDFYHCKFCRLSLKWSQSHIHKRKTHLYLYMFAGSHLIRHIHQYLCMEIDKTHIHAFLQIPQMALIHSFTFTLSLIHQLISTLALAHITADSVDASLITKGWIERTFVNICHQNQNNVIILKQYQKLKLDVYMTNLTKLHQIMQFFWIAYLHYF